MLEEVEIWKDVTGYEGLYQISNFGRIKSLDRIVQCKYFKKKCVGLIMLQTERKGYLGICLSKNSKSKIFLVHRLVAQMFIPNPENKPEVNHKDGNKLNNNDWNLEWNTKSENSIHKFKIGLSIMPKGESSFNAKFSDSQVEEIRELYATGKYTLLKLAECTAVLILL